MSLLVNKSSLRFSFGKGTLGYTVKTSQYEREPSGYWVARWTAQHINVLERRSVLLTLRKRTDNTVTAVYNQAGLG